MHEPVNPQSLQNLAPQGITSAAVMGNLNELPTLPSTTEMEGVYGDDLDQIYSDHNILINKILNEEEDLIEKHKQHVNEIINVEKQEM